MTQHAKHINNANLHSPSNDQSAQHFFGGNKEQTQTPFFGNNILQPKLKVGSKDDAFEKQADSVADKVVQGQSHSENITNVSLSSSPISSNAVQSKEEEIQTKSEEEPVQSKEEDIQTKLEEEPVQSKEEDIQTKSEEEPIQSKEEDIQTKSEEEPIQSKEEEIQTKSEEEPIQSKEEDIQTKSEEEPIQTKRLGRYSHLKNSNDFELKLNASKTEGSLLENSTKQQMESAIGADFSNVKIHTGSNAEILNQQLNAKAFTNKNDIYFGKDKFKPETNEGKFLLAHELTHTVQQGVSPKMDKGNSTETPEINQNVQTNTNNTGTKTEKPSNELLEDKKNDKLSQSAVSENGEIISISETEKPKEKGKNKKSGEGKGNKTIRNPQEDPNFIAVTEGANERATEQSDHIPAETASGTAQQAALSPENERGSMAEAAQIENMNEQEPEEFNAESFKAMLISRIEQMQLPANEDEADDFENHNNISEVNQRAVGDVVNESNRASGNIEQATTAEPNTGAIPEREIVPLPDVDTGTAPMSINAQRAVPQPRSSDEVETPLQDNVAEMDTKMSDANVTDTQLEKSEEPKFTKALESKNKAKKDAETAPGKLRNKEQNIREQKATESENISAENLNGMHDTRTNALQQVFGQQQNTGQQDTSERTRVSNQINAIFETAKTEVEGILTQLDTDVTNMFSNAAEKAKANFESYIDRRMTAYKARRYGGLLGWTNRVVDVFAGLPDEVNEFFVEGRARFVNEMDIAITSIAEHVANELNRAKQRIQQGRIEVSEYVESLPQNLQDIGREAASEIQDKFDSLTESVNSAQDSLVDSLANQYMEALNEVDARIEEMQAANRGLIDAALDFIGDVINTIIELKNMIMNLLSAIASAIDYILEDPIAFMKMLFDGIKKGLEAFKENIQQHLMAGFIEWLTGALGPMGITLPDDIFSLKGIFQLLMQILGLGWDFIRRKAVKLLGENTVTVLETGFEMFQLFAREGINGVWEHLKEQFTDLKETVIGTIKEMLITQVVFAGIKWLVGLIVPGAGFIKAIIAIKDFVVFFVQSAMALIPTITEAILALVGGSVAGVVNTVQNGLARLLPVVINLFARLLGLGGLSKKVMAIFVKIRKRIDKAVDKLILKAKKAAGRLLGRARGRNTRPTNPQEHDAQVRAGLQYLKEQERIEDKNNNNALTLEEATKVANRTKRQFPVFTSVTPKKVGGNWVYEWRGSAGEVRGDRIEEDDEATPNVKVADLIKAKYTSGFYLADITAIKSTEKEVEHKYRYKKLTRKTEKNSFKSFNEKMKNGDILKVNNERQYLINNRPSYEAGLVDKVWNKAMVNGRVFDPNTNPRIELFWDRTKSRFSQWHMGHKRGHKYSDLVDAYINGDKTKEEFLEDYNNENNYYPEDPHSNMSHKFE